MVQRQSLIPARIQAPVRSLVKRQSERVQQVGQQAPSPRQAPRRLSVLVRSSTHTLTTQHAHRLRRLPMHQRRFLPFRQ